MRYECHVGSPGFFLLNQACLAVARAFDATPYLVGSSTASKDWRDVDVRVIVADDEFDRLFPGCRPHNPRTHAMWSLLCSSTSLWLSQATGLPVDFQVQAQSVANRRFGGEPRIPLGIFPTPAKPEQT